MTPAELLSAARDLQSRPGFTGVWPRACALLIRQALEVWIDSAWVQRGWEPAGVSWRAKLLCMDLIVSDVAQAARVRQLWADLSMAVHHRAYELSPTGAELGAWSRDTNELLTNEEAAG